MTGSRELEDEGGAVTEDLHRRFGVECNNGTWRLLDRGGPGADAQEDDKARFLYRAFASAYHWMETPSASAANRARAEHLISRAAVAVERPGLAMRHARRCLEICEAEAGAVEDWDLAFAHEALARAYAARGDFEEARAHRDKALSLGKAVADEGDREVFLAELEQEPWFGMSQPTNS